MSGSNSPRSDTPEPRRVVAGQLAYGALFAVVLPLLLAAWAFALERRVKLPPVGSRPMGLALAICGALLMALGVIYLRVKGGGWPMSPFPPRQFVTSGPYALVADPLYAGSVLAVAGVSMQFHNAAGIWIVTPVLAAACAAFVWGSESERTHALFGERRSPPLLHLPAASDVKPTPSDRLATYFLALLPWFLVYQGINQFATPRDAFHVVWPLDARVPIIGWTELIYFSVYAIVLFAPLVARTAGELRSFTIAAWVATSVSALIYVGFPTTFEHRAVPASIFAPLMEWERAFDANNTAFPAFHVIWPMLALRLYTRAFSRTRVLYWPLVLAIGVSCLTTGMHAIADVIAGVLLGALFANLDRVWRLLVRGAEIVAASRAEWRVGPLRLINHGLYAALGAALGVAVAITLAGRSQLGAILFVVAAAIAGAAIWAQWVEGSSALLRPFGYYGGVIGGASAIALSSLWSGSGLQLLAAFAAGAPFVQAAGRLRCLVQGCCHGRPVQHAIGMRVTEPSSRIVRIAHLGGVPLHPTALYSIVVNLATGILLLRLWALAVPVALIAGVYFILAGLTRFVEEHYRGEPQTRTVAGLRLYQWMSIASVILGCLLTALPSSAAPPPEAVSATTIAATLAAGLAAYVAYGVDFPESNRRFARLT
jgi:prolipoprotein diacylglyceryltransferase/protein-S-isoprenylcysteine O-methyltransferase Ste14